MDAEAAKTWHKLITDTYAQLGFWGSVGFVAVGLFIFILYEVVRYSIVRNIKEDSGWILTHFKKVFSGFTAPRPASKLDLKNIPAFRRYKSLIQHKEAMFSNIKCPLRRHLMRDFFEMYFKVSLECYERFVNECDVNEIPMDQLRNTMETLLLEVDTKWREALKLRSFPLAVIQHYKTKEEDKRKYISGFVIDLVSGASYLMPDNASRFLQFFETVSSLDNTVLLVLERTVMEMNGAISSLSYEGEKCNKCPVCVSVQSRFFPEWHKTSPRLEDI